MKFCDTDRKYLVKIFEKVIMNKFTPDEIFLFSDGERMFEKIFLNNKDYNFFISSVKVNFTKEYERISNFIIRCIKNACSNILRNLEDYLHRDISLLFDLCDEFCFSLSSSILNTFGKYYCIDCDAKNDDSGECYIKECLKSDDFVYKLKKRYVDFYGNLRKETIYKLINLVVFKLKTVIL